MQKLSIFLIFVMLSAHASIVFSQTTDQFDLLITNARIVDGTGNPWFRGSIAIKNGRIAKVGRFDASGAKRTIDAGGQIVAPGDPDTRKKILEEMKKNLRDRGFTDYSWAWVASYAADPSYNGKNIREITKLARGRDKTEDQIDQILEMYEKGGAGMVYRTMSEADVQNIMLAPFTMIASDSSVRDFNVGMPHPRGYGNNTRVLGHYVRDEKTITLEDAIRKMTSLPAQTFSLRDRGLIRGGFAADLVIFDEAKITDKATFQAPHHFAEGIIAVIVNGEAVFADGKMTGVMPGQALFGQGRQ
jgi:N-acyl-D-amino-acid deacylase